MLFEFVCWLWGWVEFVNAAGGTWGFGLCEFMFVLVDLVWDAGYVPRRVFAFRGFGIWIGIVELVAGIVRL